MVTTECVVVGGNQLAGLDLKPHFFRWVQSDPANHVSSPHQPDLAGHEWASAFYTPAENKEEVHRECFAFILAGCCCNFLTLISSVNWRLLVFRVLISA
jgi:hypothetical protein